MPLARRGWKMTYLFSEMTVSDIIIIFMIVFGAVLIYAIIADASDGR